MRKISFVFLCVFICSSSLYAQNNSVNSFVTPTDQDLAVKSVTLAPVTDNVGGIYAKPIEAALKQQIDSDLQWSFIPFPQINPPKNFLENDPANVLQIMQASATDAVLEARLTKGSRGINAALTLFVGKQGLPFLQETLMDFKGFDIAEVNAEFVKMFSQLKAKMPFKGIILSRRGNDVTLNLGKTYGLRAGMNVTVVQITKINRHPKLHFMVSNEKEVLGRVQLTKVDNNLSFGSVVYERESGVIAVGSKILPEEFVKYPTPVVTPDGRVLKDLSARGDKGVAFGENPQEWQPEADPQYGKISLLAGISSYEQNSDIIATGAVSGKNGLAPNIAIRGELWLNPQWFVNFGLRQSVFSVSNGLAGSTPSSLNMSLGQYSVSTGYNVLLDNDFFGSKLKLNAGFASSKFSVDNSSPLAFTTMEYSGLLLGVGGEFPLSREIPISVGAQFNLWLNPNVSEEKSSGSSSNSMNSFSFYADYRLKKRMTLKSELLFEYFKSDFSGTASRTNPASGTSHKMTTLFAGVEYLF